MQNLLELEEEVNAGLLEKELVFDGFEDYKQILSSYSTKQSPGIKILKELNFELHCENEDFIMVFSALQNR